MMDLLLKNNTLVKIFAFFLALMLWVYVSGDRAAPDVTLPFRNVPISYHNLDEQLQVMQIPEEIDIILSGRSSILQDLTPQSITIYVDLQDLGEGRHSLVPQAEVPRGVRINAFVPQQVVVELEEVESPQEPVVLEIFGTPADGFVMAEAQITPDSVFVRGPRSLLAEVDRVQAIINVDGADGDRVQMVPVRAVNRFGQQVEGVVVNPAMVEVTIPFSEPQITVPIRVPLDGSPAEGYRWVQTTVEPTEVTLQGPEDALAEILEVLTERVDINGATETISRELTLVIPEGVEIIVNDRVQVEIEISPE